MACLCCDVDVDERLTFAFFLVVDWDFSACLLGVGIPLFWITGAIGYISGWRPPQIDHTVSSVWSAPSLPLSVSPLSSLV